MLNLNQIMYLIKCLFRIVHNHIVVEEIIICIIQTRNFDLFTFKDANAFHMMSHNESLR